MLTKTILLLTVIVGIVIFLTSCKTYYIPLESFKQQFSNFDTSNLREVATRGPAGDVLKYKTYPIDIIKCVDQNGQPIELKNGPSIDIRFTDNNSKRTVFILI